MKTFCCCLLLLSAMTAPAQNRQPLRSKYPPHQVAVSINPLALVNTEPRLMAGVERRFAPRWSMLADAGVVVASAYIENIKKVNGFEIRPAIRYYYGKKMDGYLQGQLQYRRVNYKMHEWLGQDCVNEVPAYEKLQDFTFRKQNFGMALVGGGIEQLGRHLFLDISVGLGLQHRSQRVAGNENSCFIPFSNFSGNPQQNNIWVPILPMAVKLAYVIR